MLPTTGRGMRLLVANPNSTEAITGACVALARAAASPETDIVAALETEVRRAHTEHGADSVILGGSRLGPYAAALRARTPIPVIEPVACAVTIAEALVRLGLAQSKVGKFGPPPRPLAEYG